MRRLLFLTTFGLILAAHLGAQSPEPIDYSSASTWLCLPGREDACTIDHTTTVIDANGSFTTEAWSPDANPPIDCFYVYPTVSTDSTPNSDMVADDAERNVIRQQFARFGSVCRQFAPMYRQVTLRGLGGGGATAGLNYGDVLRAWRYYLENYNEGRGVVLIGHSQGSYVLRDLIAREVDGQPDQALLVSAILTGATVPVSPSGAGGAFREIPLCRSGQQVGCLIAYASYRATTPPPENARFGRVTEDGIMGACTSPPALLGRGEALHGYLSRDGRTITGTRTPPPWVVPERLVPTDWVSVPGLLTGRCVTRGMTTYLEVTVHGDPGDPRTDEIIGDIGSGDRVALDWGLHLIDINIAMGDLVEIVRRQGEAWSRR